MSKLLLALEIDHVWAAAPAMALRMGDRRSGADLSCGPTAEFEAYFLASIAG